MISVTASALNEEEIIESFCDEVTVVLKTLGHDFEIIVVDNGSTDRTLEILKQVSKTNPHVAYVSLSRNFGHQGGLLAGIHHCKGAAVITMDSDLQHPPALIPTFVQEWKAGYPIVQSVKIASQTNFFRNALDKIFYYLLGKLSNLEIGQGDFRLMDRVVVEHLKSMPESQKFIRGLIGWLGYPTKFVKYRVQKRQRGQTKFSYNHLIDFAVQGITAFSVTPLKLLTRLGVAIFIPSFGYMVIVVALTVYSYFSGEYVYPPGWPTVVAAITLFGSIQLLALGILGEYIGRIYFETKRRPHFIVREFSKDPR